MKMLKTLLEIQSRTVLDIQIVCLDVLKGFFNGISRVCLKNTSFIGDVTIWSLSLEYAELFTEDID